MRIWFRFAISWMLAPMAAASAQASMTWRSKVGRDFAADSTTCSERSARLVAASSGAAFTREFGDCLRETSWVFVRVVLADQCDAVKADILGPIAKELDSSGVAAVGRRLADLVAQRWIPEFSDTTARVLLELSWATAPRVGVRFVKAIGATGRPSVYSALPLQVSGDEVYGGGLGGALRRRVGDTRIHSANPTEMVLAFDSRCVPFRAIDPFEKKP